MENLNFEYSKYKKIALALLEECKSENLSKCEAEYVLNVAKGILSTASSRVPLDILCIHYSE